VLECAYAYYANASPFILDPALLKIVGLALFIGAFWDARRDGDHARLESFPALPCHPTRGRGAGEVARLAVLRPITRLAVLRDFPRSNLISREGGHRLHRAWGRQLRRRSGATSPANRSSRRGRGLQPPTGIRTTRRRRLADGCTAWPHPLASDVGRQS